MNVSIRQKSSIRLLGLFNVILLGVSWLMMVRAYPRLPDEIPYWLPLAGQDILRAPKGPFFFLYPLFQTLFLLAFYLAGMVWAKKPEKGGDREIPEKKKTTTGKISAYGKKISPEGEEEIDAAGSSRQKSPVSEVESNRRRRFIPKEAETEYRPGEISPGLQAALLNLKTEMVWLLMIFFNLVFIHVQRSLIWLAHGLSFGVNKFYFFSLIVIILLLIPYYRFRLSLLNRGHR